MVRTRTNVDSDVKGLQSHGADSITALKMAVNLYEAFIARRFETLCWFHLQGR
jgi:hypothetical protein